MSNPSLSYHLGHIGISPNIDQIAFNSNDARDKLYSIRKAIRAVENESIKEDLYKLEDALLQRNEHGSEQHKQFVAQIKELCDAFESMLTLVCQQHAQEQIQDVENTAQQIEAQIQENTNG